MTNPDIALAARRVAAMAVDWSIISGYAAALVPLGLFLSHRSVDLGPAGWNTLSFILLVLPATGWLAAWETGTKAASPGKRLLKLKVVAPGRLSLGWQRGLARNALKIALPWESGHTGAFILADPTAGQPAVAVGLACAAAACLLAAVYVTSLFIGAGRTPYDRAAGTRVTMV